MVSFWITPQAATSFTISLKSHRRAVIPQHNRDMVKGTLMSVLREAGFGREDLISFLGG